MTEVMIDTAEEEFLNYNITGAFRWALSAKIVDPFYKSVDVYLEAYRIHYDHAHKRTRNGEIDWYAVLNINNRFVICFQAITHHFVKVAKMIDPDEHCSAAAPGALKLITAAWEIVGEPGSQWNYHIRAGLAPPECFEYCSKSPMKKRCIAVEQPNIDHGSGHRQA